MSKRYDDVRSNEGRGVKLFDVTVKTVIGSVFQEQFGTMTPRQAAYMIVCDFNSDGEYEFPTEDGQIETIVVKRRDIDPVNE